MIDPDVVLAHLSQQRPIFHSEADFPHALAWLIRLQHTEARIRLEHRPRPTASFYLDLWAQDHRDAVAIELKESICHQGCSWHRCWSGLVITDSS